MAQVEARLERIERQLNQVLGVVQQSRGTAVEESVSAAESVASSEEPVPGVIDYFEGREDSPMVGGHGVDSHLKLPPLDEVLPLVADYFLCFNSGVPLFHQPTFMRMLYEWYSPSPSPRRDTASWAAVNIVLALAHRCSLERRVGLGLEGEIVSQCLRNAQSVVSDLVTREEDLLGLQVILGMVLLFQGTRDSKPASVLIGTAIRLAHRMQLHTRETLKFFPVEVQEQRSRLFWLTYALDKVGCLSGRLLRPPPRWLTMRPRILACDSRRRRSSWTLISTWTCPSWTPKTEPGSSARPTVRQR
jgi:hypothetical protein